MSTKGSGIIYLHKDGFQLYSPLYATLFEFHFIPEIVRDLEIINEDLLKELITIFITNNKIPPLTLAFVLADNACFIQDFSSASTVDVADSKDITEKVEKFIDHVPYDAVASKTFPIPNGLRALATNQSLYDAIKSAFIDQGFIVYAILPGLPFGDTISARPTIDIPTAAILLQKYNSFKEYNLTTHSQINTIKKEEVKEIVSISNEPVTYQSDKGLDKKSEKKRLIILIGVFIILVILLIIVYINSQTPPTPAITQNSTQKMISRSASVAGIATASATALTRELPNLSVQIITASATSVDDLQSQLKSYPFKSVTLQEEVAKTDSKGVIIFSPNVSIATRELIVSELKKTTDDIIVQERANAIIDITIIINK